MLSHLIYLFFVLHSKNLLNLFLFFRFNRASFQKFKECWNISEKFNYLMVVLVRLNKLNVSPEK